jgi:formylglycine-generating enzyme required for sulfatase activity
MPGWDLAQKAHGRQRDCMLLRAGYWYEEVAAGPEAGEYLTKIEPRRQALAKQRIEVLPARVLTNSIGVPLVLIPAGEFVMGSTPEDIAWALAEGEKISGSKSHLDVLRSESPQHRVKISRPFYLGTYVITQSEYEKVVGVNPSGFTAKQIDSLAFKPPLSENEVNRRAEARKKVEGMDARRHPVETVNWDEAAEFCRRLSSSRAERTAQRVYRLPTEAEWEYACRAGTTSRWYNGDNAAELADIAWFGDNAGAMTHAVGQKRPNAWGLFDMSGNVYQWCADRFSVDYYAKSAPTDPTGPAAGTARVLRGGCWDNIPPFCRSAYRYAYSHTAHSRPFGFRVVVERGVVSRGPAVLQSP